MIGKGTRILSFLYIGLNVGGHSDIVTISVADVEYGPDREKCSGRGLLAGVAVGIRDFLHAGLGGVSENADAL